MPCAAPFRSGIIAAMRATFTTSLSRRRFLAGSAALAVAPKLALANNPGDAPFDLVAGTSAHPIRGTEHPPVPLWTFNQSSPGPTLRIRRGETLRVRLANNLSEDDTSVHWHGMRVDNAMDGVPGLTQDAVAPGETFDYEVAAPDAGTFWYHSHSQSWKQVARGLYGPLIVDDPDANEPRADRDIALMIDDWKLARGGGGLDEKTFGHLGEWSHGGRMGNWLTVNGEPNPTFNFPSGGRIRLRMINPANARIFRLSLPPRLEAKVVALDGMPVAPRDFPPDGFVLAPAQRADVVLDLPNESGEWKLTALFSRGAPAELATFRATPSDERLAKKTAWPSPPRLKLPPTQNAKRGVVHMIGGAMGGMREAKLNGELLPIRELAQRGKLWAFNDRVGGHDFELLRLRPGETGILRVENDTAWPHAMHLHGHHFIPTPAGGTDGNGAGGGGDDLVLRDTHLLNRGESSDYVFVGGKPGKWLFHCHMLEHHEAGMAGVVVVA